MSPEERRRVIEVIAAWIMGGILGVMVVEVEDPESLVSAMQGAFDAMPRIWLPRRMWLRLLGRIPSDAEVDELSRDVRAHVRGITAWYAENP